MKPNQQRGVALVITLIMLSVITFLAVAFLALTRRDKAAVNVSLTQTDARFMADTALARAEAEIMSRIIATTNILNYDLLLTQNYINTNGYNGTDDLLDVNYDITTGGAPLSDNQLMQNVANLFYDPRPPVYIKTNETGPLDFRFYLDSNRNRRFDTNGFQYAFDEFGNIIGTNIFMWGDAEWIGVLEKPQYRHSATNRFVGRYLYLAVPEGKTLDVNSMHNYVKGTSPEGSLPNNMTAGDGFLRNQGVGSWELNLAAFLQDLNSNLYEFTGPYNYQTNIGLANPGGPFEDALSLLRYRYRKDPADPNSSDSSTLASVDELFPFNFPEFQKDNFDAYSDGPLMYNSSNLVNETRLSLVDPTGAPWSGSKNTNSYRHIDELFDVNKTSLQFVQRLGTVLARSNTHDNQTFSRLLSQLGTTSDTNNTYVVAGRTYPKIHLNYDNLAPNTDGFAHQTNFFQWEPLSFFTNAADALIRKTLIRADKDNHYIGGLAVGTNFSLTNIMVYPTNQYTPTVHRLLQLAANIYSASTDGFTDTSTKATNYPVVFRPQFSREGTNIFITGYEEVTTNGLDLFEQGFTNLNLVAGRNAIAAAPGRSQLNVAGVPWVVSAKKGLPNFNEFSFETVLQITRKMELRKPNANPYTEPNETNLMYTIGITNFVGTEFWNSYQSNFMADLTIRFTNIYSASLTNQSGLRLTNRLVRYGFERKPTGFPGAVFNRALNPNSFLVEQGTINFLGDSAYVNVPAQFISVTNATFQRNQGLYVPDWDLLLTNQVAAIVVHDESKRVLDFVNLGNSVTHIDINKELFPEKMPISATGNGEGPLINALWNTNRVGNNPQKPTIGMLKQIDVSLGEIPPGNLWKDYSPKTRKDISIEKQIDEFRYFMGLSPIYGNTNLTPTNRMQVPFTPSRALYVKSAFQANDPLVHYMANDLVEPGKTSVTRAIVPPTKGYGEFSENNLRQINDRYSPWGGKRVPGQTAGSGGFQYEPALKDPMVRWSDDWDFPTNKFPNIGWLGRVHRGSPWQTMYLKSGVASDKDWVKWAGSGHTHATNDWFLLDLFTAAPNDNAARGHLSVNQSNLASWSAALSGVMVLSNSYANTDSQLNAVNPPKFESLAIEPSSAQLNNIVDGINLARTKVPNQVFSSVGEILAAPELTLNSPFLNLTDAKQQQYGMDDEAYERIPQMILSLLKVGHPRYAIYSYGQALRPAPNSIVISPPVTSRHLQNICTNYQIAGEVVTKTVLRVEGTPDSPKAVVESFEIISED